MCRFNWTRDIQTPELLLLSGQTGTPQVRSNISALPLLLDGLTLEKQLFVSRHLCNRCYTSTTQSIEKPIDCSSVATVPELVIAKLSSANVARNWP